jgi:predicted aminopeptidase
VALLALSSSGCGTLSYLAQAGYGQREISLSARPIDDVVADPSVPERTRAMLREIPAIKRFGEDNGLKATRNYRSFSDLHRRQVVWVVSGCAPLAFSPKVWNFPIVGGVTYLGWFDRKDADAEGARLRAAGWDVDVRGSTAYSTLGWFDDPVLSTMLGEGEGAIGDLAETVLHESLHATLYVKNQSPFDESVATWFGDRLGERYLLSTRGEGSRELATWRAGQAEGDRRAAVLHGAYDVLAAVYSSAMSREDKLARKAAIIAETERRLGATRPLTNATIVQFKTYHEGTADLDALHAACGGSFSRLLSALRTATFVRQQDEDVASVYRRLVTAGCP